MRIGIDARLWKQTGVGRYIRNLVLNLEKIDQKNDYFLFVRREDEKEVEIQNPKFKVIPVEVRWHSLREQIEFPKIIKKENLDLMHFPYISVPVFYNRPFVVTIHDLIPYYFSTGKASSLPYPLYNAKKLGYKFILSKAIINSKKIIVPSYSVKNELIKKLNTFEDKIVVTYEGVDRNIKNKAKVKTQNFGKYFLYVGNAYPHKNLETLILSFSKLSFPASRLVVVGKEDFFLKRIKKFAEKLKINNRINFVGQVSDEELSRLYSNAMCVVVTSFAEGFSLMVLEAMSLECPALISDIPVHREIAGENALYFDPKNSGDLKDKMQDVLDGKLDLQKMAEKAFERSKEFSWEKMAKETLDIYTSL